MTSKLDRALGIVVASCITSVAIGGGLSLFGFKIGNIIALIGLTILITFVLVVFWVIVLE